MATGQLSIQGDGGDNSLREWTGNNGYLYIDVDGQVKTSDPGSVFFDARLRCATGDTVKGITFNGGDGRDTLILGNQDLSDSLQITADDDILINGNLKSGDRIDVEAENITSQGALSGRGITLNSSDVLQLESGSITAQDGDKGGTIHLLGKEVSLIGTEVNADGMNGGGTVLIGGDYQGKGSVPNAWRTMISSDTTINANALQSGNGGRVIVWADGDTKFSGKINARGGSAIGDGGFAEVSGKQNLTFNGTANLDAINGKLGTFLLDPENIRISDLSDNSETEPNIYNYSSLENISGNVLLEATKNITIDPDISLNFRNPLSTVTFIAGELFSMDSKAGINATGKTDITISAKGIEAGSIYTGGGRINLSADGDISVGGLYSRGEDIGGDIDVTSSGGSIIFEEKRTEIDVSSGEEFIVYSPIMSEGESTSGNINLKAEKSINLRKNVATFVRGSSKSANVGNINITSVAGDILNLEGASAAGFGTSGGGAIKIKSEQGSISLSYIQFSNNYGIRAVNGDIEVAANGDINLGSIESYSIGYGNREDGGAISLTSVDGKITTGPIRAFGGSQGTGGDVKVNAAKDIYVQEVQTSSGSGDGGMIKLRSNQGKVTVGFPEDQYSGFLRSNSGSGSGGDIEVFAAKDINVAYDVSSNSGESGNGGAISLTSTDGNITTGYLGSDSAQGIGGDIAIDAGKLVKITDSENIDGIDYSIYTDGVISSTISIKGGNSEGIPFIVGDTTTNGTSQAIATGEIIVLPVSIFSFGDHTPDGLPDGSWQENIPEYTIDSSSGEDILVGELEGDYLLAGLPRDGVGGAWLGVRGNSGWQSTNPAVNSITGGAPIEFRNGFPDFTPYERGGVTLPKLNKTSKTDMYQADKLYAKQQGWFKSNGNPDVARAAQYRTSKGLVWHHREYSTRLQLVPKAINSIPHTGGRATGGTIGCGPKVCILLTPK